MIEAPEPDRDFVGALERYVDDVLSDRQVACRWVRLACERHRRDLARVGTDGFPYVFDEWHVDDVCGFAELMPHVEGEWATPNIVLEDWQVFVLGSVFGWRRLEDDLRRFDTVYLEVARKNAKSVIAAVVALYAMTCEGEPGPQVKTAATTGAQARIVWNTAAQMARITPAFRESFGVQVLANSIVSDEIYGSIQPINAKASTQDGLNPHCSILDELHAHKTRKLFDVLRSARGARRNPLTWSVTTAGYDMEGVCYEQRKLLTQILARVLDIESFFGLVYTLDEDDDPYDSSVWPKANPNYGVSVLPREFLDYAATSRTSPDSEAEFLTKRVNVWTGAGSPWLDGTAWRACDGAVDTDALRHIPCWGGLDLASTSDIAALVFVWEVDGDVLVWCRGYIPEDTVQPRTERANVPYARWVREGHLVATAGNVTDYAVIEADVRACMDDWSVQDIAFDPWNATDVVNRLVEDGAPMIQFRQGFQSFNPPCRELERRVKAGTLAHGGNPMLGWMATNVVIRRDVNDNIAPDRKRSGEKIDGIVATVMAMGRMLVREGSGIVIPANYSVTV